MTTPWNVSESVPMKLAGKPKPPPAPDPTPAERRQVKLAAALKSLCDTFEMLARETEAEQQVRDLMKQQQRRIEEASHELEEINQSGALRRAAHSMEEVEAAEQLRQRVAALKEEEQALEDRIKLSVKELKEGLPLTAKLKERSRESEDDGAAVNRSQVVEDRSPRWIDQGTDETVQLLNVMMTSSVREVRLRTAAAIVIIAERSHVAKVKMSEADGIGESMVNLLRSGGLEAIEAIAVLTTDNPAASNLFRKHGAVALLAGFINNESSEAAKPNKYNPDTGLVSKPAQDVERPTIVPVSTKSMAVVALRNIATSSPDNLDHITAQGGVIPQLVQLMTKMNEEVDNASSAGSSRDSSNDSEKGAAKKGSAGKKDRPERSKEEKERRKAERRGKLNDSLKNAMQQDMIDRKKLARDNKRLAESAGKMLHTLIIKGKREVKRIIISAIIEQVQQPGSVPPEDVPALMEILRSTAEEQLGLVTSGNDEKALASALQFGRWVKLPALMLGEARNNFKLSQDFAKERDKQRKRRIELGLPPDDGGTEQETDRSADDEDQAEGPAAAGNHDDAMEVRKQQLQSEDGQPANAEGGRRPPPQLGAQQSSRRTQRTSRGGVKTGRNKANEPRVVSLGGRLLTGQWSARKDKPGDAERRRQLAEQRKEDDARRKKKQSAIAAQAKLVTQLDQQRNLVASASRRKAEKYSDERPAHAVSTLDRMLDMQTEALDAAANGRRPSADGRSRGWSPKLGAVPESGLLYFENNAGPSIHGFEYDIDKLVASRRLVSRKLVEGSSKLKGGRAVGGGGISGGVTRNAASGSAFSGILASGAAFDPGAPPLSKSAEVWSHKLRAMDPSFSQKDEWARLSKRARHPSPPLDSAAAAALDARKEELASKLGVDKLVHQKQQQSSSQQGEFRSASNGVRLSHRPATALETIGM